jgi:aminopeptidase N
MPSSGTSTVNPSSAFILEIGSSWRVSFFIFLTLGISPPPSLSAQQVDVWSRPVQTERSRDFDFIHYRVELDFDLDAKVFRGENRITLAPLMQGVEHCEIDAEEIVIEAVLGQTGEELPFERTDTSFVITFPQPVSHGDTFDLTIRYRGENPEKGFFFDDATEDHPQMVSTDSWPNEAHHWIPLYDYPHDKVTHELIITVPEGNRVLSNGRLVAVRENVEDRTSTWHWSQDLPHSTYLFMLAIGPFTVIEDSLGDLPVSYWVYPEDEEDARWIFAKTPRMIEFYSELFGFPYPWAKYDQVTTPHVGGGAEATSATILGDGVIHDRRAEQDFSWEGTIAHEIAHQWWGDLVTLREWSHTWLNESFATYSDYLWTRYELGDDAGAWELLEKKNRYLREARNRYIRPIVFDRYDHPGDNFDSHTYPKGACILHQLRYLLGDEPFFRTLSTFLNEYAFEPVDTHDFMKTVKEVTGQNMDWFFEQFIFSPGHPILEVASEWDSGAGEVRLSVSQVQNRGHRVPIYRMPVRIGIVTPSGKRVEEVWLESEHDVFTFQAEEEPLLVRFDEGNWILKEWSYPKSIEEVLYQARHDDVIGREWAVRELGQGVGARTREVAHATAGSTPDEIADILSNLAAEDPFWAVRVAAIEVLAALHGPGTGETAGAGETARVGAAFRTEETFRATALDESSRVRRAAIQLLGEVGDPSLTPFFRNQFARDDSYQVQAEALRAIGKSGDPSQLPFLREASEMESPRDVIRSAAEWAIAEILGGR